MKSRKKYVAFGILAAILVVAGIAFIVIRSRNASAASESRRGAAPLVRLEQPQQQDIPYGLHFTGDVEAIQQAGIFAKVTGTLERVYVDIGTRVGRGDRLALIDTTELYQQYQQASATYENAKINYRRNKDLFEQNLVARQDLDNTEAALKIADASFANARTRLGYAFITAPFPGFITKRFLDPGAVVSQNNATLFTLMDLSHLKIVINVLEKDVPQVAAGKRAVITVDAFPGKSFTGTVTRFAQAVDEGTRTMAVEIDIDNFDLTLKPGMFANVDLTIDVHKNALTVPSAAILKDDRSTFVYAATADTARRIDVATGLERDGRTEILSGITAQTQIITTGQQFVRSNGPVTIQK